MVNVHGCRLWILQAGVKDEDVYRHRVHDERKFESRLRKVYGNAGDQVQVEGLWQVVYVLLLRKFKF